VKSRLHVGSWRGRQSIGQEVDSDVGVASLGAGRRVLGAVHVAQQTIFAGVGSQRALSRRVLRPPLVHGCVRMNAGGRIIQDFLDRVSAAATLGAAAEAGIDLAHAGPSRVFCNH
jgi:hypothetical protein